MTKSFNKFKKPCFWLIFGPFSQILGQKNFFPENPALSRTTSYGLLAPCQNSEKTNDTIPRKRLDGRTDRPYFIGPLRLPPGLGPINFWKKQTKKLFIVIR